MHKLPPQVTDYPRTHIPKNFPNPPSRTFAPEEYRIASLMVDHNDCHVKLYLGRGAQKRLAGGWKLKCVFAKGMSGIALE